MLAVAQNRSISASCFYISKLHVIQPILSTGLVFTYRPFQDGFPPVKQITLPVAQKCFVSVATLNNFLLSNTFQQIIN
jgi:hypothetical protein